MTAVDSSHQQAYSMWHSSLYQAHLMFTTFGGLLNSHSNFQHISIVFFLGTWRRRPSVQERPNDSTVKLFLCFNIPILKSVCGVEVEFHSFLSLALDGVKWSPSRYVLFILEKWLDDHWIRGYVGSRVGLDVLAKREKVSPQSGIELRYSKP